MLDRERLAKVLALTTSPNDSEALSAMRKANEIIKGEGLTWDEVLVQIADAVSVVNIHVQRGNFVAPEFYAAMEEWNRPKR